jgi:hypothetical protein
VKLPETAPLPRYCRLFASLFLRSSVKAGGTPKSGLDKADEKSLTFHKKGFAILEDAVR